MYTTKKTFITNQEYYINYLHMVFYQTKFSLTSSVMVGISTYSNVILILSNKTNIYLMY